MAHTPGPWEVGQYPWMISTEMDHEVAQANAGNSNYKDDVRLICAAPALLAACEALLDDPENADQSAWDRMIGKARELARAALTLAKGT